jgi:antitoxin (DNA-binding transcriptional repressor) of toxin-antitoxin stability system
MRKVNLDYAKDHLERLVDVAIAGEEVVLTREGARLVRLIPAEQDQAKAGAVARKLRRARVETLVSQLSSLPDLDERSIEEVLGYDQRGLF